MINHSTATIESLYIHFTGNLDQENIYTDHPVYVDESMHSPLLKYFFDPFKEPVFHQFGFAGEDVTMNPMYQWCDRLFHEEGTLKEISQAITKYLHQNSKHPNIKAGDLFVTKVNDVLIEDELVEAICIIKSENKNRFIKLDRQNRQYGLELQEGISLTKLDKACIIFNTEKAQGFKICVLDYANKSKEAQFWVEDFLRLKVMHNDYVDTQQVIKATKQFIEDRVKPLYEIDKADEAHLLKNTLSYLKNNESYDAISFEEEVFQDENLIKDFKEYKQDYQAENKVKLNDSFDIDNTAVKKQSKIFKSVLKLDKNFHVYIHGDRSMIERGTDPDGRRYYKLYYNEEK